MQASGLKSVEAAADSYLFSQDLSTKSPGSLWNFSNNPQAHPKICIPVTLHESSSSHLRVPRIQRMEKTDYTIFELHNTTAMFGIHVFIIHRCIKYIHIYVYIHIYIYI